ncbi:DNA-binding transcriptional regulator YbjK [Streptomyces griseochromogenes]|uniref:DNA-binding transcriptional regulator YbjK n=1 Tax=Streptomyces griseochromogenes TaxID=68214 RepID=A0A1B1B1C8_9ACTN|nr:TetR family transcriptional regulator C-terminal domain-containing protein [Streptomyces griseochromogenes]ANP52620.1 TetR family transcriptional regulator [Streptomyces griseochromogenes]MBP2047201.1 DNA-binding transcriptional regulator YbjK [Streptomyces griseochromogenes]
MPTDRRTLLADAAIGVLADTGMRGLTHRAVDRAADLPSGTTSAYYRTRQALLTALVRRLVALDQAELQEIGGMTPALRDAGEVTAGLVAFTRRRLAEPGRRRSLARYACAIESVRHPELREILVPRENLARQAVQDFLAAQGVEDAEERTVTLLTCVDGLVFDRLVNGGSVSEREIHSLVTAALR